MTRVRVGSIWAHEQLWGPWLSACSPVAAGASQEYANGSRIGCQFSRLVPCMPAAADAGADCSCGNPELHGEGREGGGKRLEQQVLGNMTTCGENTSAVKSAGVPGRRCWLLVSSWEKAVGILCTPGAHDGPQ